jgi:hypothetical protein
MTSSPKRVRAEIYHAARWGAVTVAAQSREKEDLYVSVDQVRVLRPQSGGGGTTIVFDLEHTIGRR